MYISILLCQILFIALLPGIFVEKKIQKKYRKKYKKMLYVLSIEIMALAMKLC